ncbi:MAG: hypothetical protein AAB434_09105 [Planctomycetota bacterium]
MSARLDAYLALERVMFELDAAGDDLANAIRDAMDPVWYALTDEEHARLDARKIGEVHALNPIRLSITPVVVRRLGTKGRRVVIRNRKVGISFPRGKWTA